MNLKTMIPKRPICCTALLMLCALPVFAQWIWLDAHGRKVFSDQAPPMNTPVKNILKQPTDGASIRPLPAVNAPAMKASSTQPANEDNKLQAKRRQVQASENAQQQAQAEKQRAAKAENCIRAKQGLAALQSGTRLTTPNAKGEIEPMSDQARSAEVARLQTVVSSDCL